MAPLAAVAVNAYIGVLMARVKKDVVEVKEVVTQVKAKVEAVAEVVPKIEAVAEQILPKEGNV